MKPAQQGARPPPPPPPPTPPPPPARRRAPPAASPAPSRHHPPPPFARRRRGEAGQRVGPPRGPPVRVAQRLDLPAAHGVAELIRRIGAVAPHFGLRVLPLEVHPVDQQVHCLLEGHPPGVQPHVQHDPERPPQQMHPLEEVLLHAAVKPLFGHHLFTIERPSLDRERRADDLPDGTLLLLRDQELQA